MVKKKQHGGAGNVISTAAIKYRNTMNQIEKLKKKAANEYNTYEALKKAQGKTVKPSMKRPFEYPKADLTPFQSNFFVISTANPFPLPAAALEELQDQEFFDPLEHNMLHFALHSSVYAYLDWEKPILTFIAPECNTSSQRENHWGYSQELINSAIILFNHTVELQGLHKNDENIFKIPRKVGDEYYYRLFGKVYGKDKLTIKNWHTYGPKENRICVSQPAMEVTFENFSDAPKTAKIRFMKSMLAHAVSWEEPRKH